MAQLNAISAQEISTPNLSAAEANTLLTTLNAVEQDLVFATVSVTYRKQTKTKARKAGEDYVAMPGVSMEAQTGTLSVLRRVDNKANRRKGVVGEIYMKIKSVTRADGVESFGWTNVRPSGLTAFVILGLEERDLEAEAEAQRNREATAQAVEDAKAEAVEAKARQDAQSRTLFGAVIDARDPTISVETREQLIDKLIADANAAVDNA